MNIEKKTGYALQAGEGRIIYFRGTKMTVKVSGEASEGTYSLIEMLHPPNVGPALHRHPTGAEGFYVLDGEYTIRCGGGRLYSQRGRCRIYSKRDAAQLSLRCEWGGKSWLSHRQGWRIILLEWPTC